MLKRTKALTGEQREKFLENYKEHFWNTQVSHKQDLLREDSSVQTFQDPEIKKASSAGGETLTPNKQLQLEERKLKAAKEAEKLNNIKDLTPVESSTGKERIFWDPTEKKWGKQNKTSSGDWKIDIGQPALQSKTQAAANIGITKQKPGLKTK